MIMFRFSAEKRYGTFQRHVLACLFCLLLIFGSTASIFAINYTTESYHTTLDVKTNSSMHVTETIQVNFETEAHGIFREIWNTGKCWFVKDGELIETDMLYKLENFACEGEKIKTSRENDSVSIRIGSADVTHLGPCTYKLEYDVVMYKDSLKDMDQLYWNIMPMYWQTDVEEFGFTIRMPRDFDENQLEIITGPIASGDTSRAVYTVSENTVEGKITGPIEAGEGVTARIVLPQGYWKGAPDDSPWIYALMAAIGAATFAVITLFFRYGRDPRPVRTVEFYPPEGISPAEAGYLYDKKLQRRDMISLVMWFASKGWLKIRTAENTDAKTRGKEPYKITLQKLQDVPANAPAYQRTFFNGIFKGGDKVRLDKMPGSFAAAYSNAEKELEELFTGDRDFIDRKSREAKHTGCLIGILTFLVPVLTMGFFKITEDLYSSLCGELVLSLLLIFFFLKFMLRPSDYRISMLGRLKGFRHFIKKAELDRIRRLVEDDPDYFYKVLPYAYVFGLTDRWAKNFEPLAPAMPDWYEGSADYFYTPSAFCSNFNRSMNTSIQNAMPKPSYSSFSGGSSGRSGGGGGYSSSSGGGFSGGGGGGGGGGAW